MIIVIPSMGRSNKQVTLSALATAQYKREIRLAVPARERRKYEVFERANIKVVPVPDEVKGIAETRRWILMDHDWGDNHVLMIDDDMDFCYRPDMERDDLVMVKEQPRIYEMVDRLTGWLNSGRVHVGLSARQNNHQFPAVSGSDHDPVTKKPREYRDAARMMNMYAYDTFTLRRLPVEVGRTPVMEDFDLTLQLLRMGHANRVDYRFCWNQRGSGAAGGCSTYRTAEMQSEAAKRLAELHAPYVKLTVKKSKESSTSWGGMKERYDVNIQWRQAYESSGKELTS